MRNLCVTAIEYGTEIDTGGAQGVYHLQKFAKKLLDDMLKQRIIELASGPWSSPNVLVSNKDGTPCFHWTIIE